MEGKNSEKGWNFKNRRRKEKALYERSKMMFKYVWCNNISFLFQSNARERSSRRFTMLQKMWYILCGSILSYLYQTCCYSARFCVLQRLIVMVFSYLLFLPEFFRKFQKYPRLSKFCKFPSPTSNVYFLYAYTLQKQTKLYGFRVLVISKLLSYQHFFIRGI